MDKTITTLKEGLKALLSIDWKKWQNKSVPNEVWWSGTHEKLPMRPNNEQN